MFLKNLERKSVDSNFKLGYISILNIESEQRIDYITFENIFKKLN